MAGLASAVLIAFLTNRTLRADFPGLQQCFGTLGPPIPPEMPLQYAPVDIHFPKLLHVTPVNGSRDSAILNAMGELVNHSILPQLTPYRTVYYHSNRGVTSRLLPPQADPNHPIPVWHVNHCILRTLFLKPRKKFLRHSVELLGGKSTTVKDLMNEIKNSPTTSIGIHVRLDDNATRRDEKALRDQHVATVRNIDLCILRMSKFRRRVVVYLSSNSDSLGATMWANYGALTETRLISQKPGLIRHIDFSEWPAKYRNSSSPDFHIKMNSAVVATVVDFLLLSRTKALLFSCASGFSMGAALISDVQPTIMNLGSCGLTSRQCVGRFCDL